MRTFCEVFYNVCEFLKELGRTDIDVRVCEESREFKGACPCKTFNGMLLVVMVVAIGYVPSGLGIPSLPSRLY